MRSGLAERVYEELEQRIFDLEYSPGARLVIDQIAREFGVSATPVRDALRRLAAERVIAFEPYVGFTVLPEPTLDEIRESFQARLAIEGFAARIGCKLVTDDQIDELVRIQRELMRHRYGGTFKSFIHFVSWNKRFHEVIVATSGNRYLVDAAKNLYHDALIARTLHDRGVPDIAEISAEHEAIIDAFRRRDEDDLYRAVEAHITDGCRRMIAARTAPARAPLRSTRRGRSDTSDDSS